VAQEHGDHRYRVRLIHLLDEVDYRRALLVYERLEAVYLDLFYPYILGQAGDDRILDLDLGLRDGDLAVDVVDLFLDRVLLALYLGVRILERHKVLAYLPGLHVRLRRRRSA